MAITRQQIVDKAREFIGTPFQHQGRVKGRATDCVGVPLMLAEELGLSDKSGKPLKGSDYAAYSSQPLGNMVYQIVRQHLVWKNINDVKPGDVLVLRVPEPSHVAIVGENQHGLTIIHAYNSTASRVDTVIETRLDQRWLDRVAGCFKFPEVED